MRQPFIKQILELSKYLQPHKKVLIISFLLSMISTALGMIQPLFAKKGEEELVLLTHQHLVD